jgi:hypothetical protein
VTGVATPPSTPPVPAAVKITSAGVVPPLLHLFERAGVTFANNDSRAHDVRADPGNVDSRCTRVGVGVIQPSERRRTDELPPGLNCAYLDGADPGNGAFRGVIITH